MDFKLDLYEDTSIEASIINTELSSYNKEFVIKELRSKTYVLLSTLIFEAFSSTLNEKYDIEFEDKTIRISSVSTDLLKDISSFMKSFELLKNNLKYFKEYLFEKPYNLIVDDDMEIMMLWYRDDNSMCSITFSENSNILFASSEAELGHFTKKISPEVINEIYEIIWRFESFDRPK